MWRDMNRYDWLNKLHNFSMATIVGIISRHGLRIEVHHRNQPNKSKLLLYKLYLNSQLKQLYISNKTKQFSYIYKGGCSICMHTHIEVLKRGAGLNYTAIGKQLWVILKWVYSYH